MTSIPALQPSLTFLLGLAVVILYAWDRFNEPSFPRQEMLPSAVVPLRYMFSGSGYIQARISYAVVLGIIYSVLCLVGPQVINLDRSGSFPPAAFPLSVALVIVGIVTNPSLKWINFLEESIRRLVHQMFLVPDGVKATIGVLADSNYAPPADQLQAVPAVRQQRIKDGLQLPVGSLHYRWARTMMLMESLNQIGSPSHPLRSVHFAPFSEDFRSIKATYNSLLRDIEPSYQTSLSNEAEANLKEAVDPLLVRIYAFISWLVRHQAESERIVHETLRRLGFLIVVPAGRRILDLVLFPFLLVMLLQFLYTLSFPQKAGDGVEEAVYSALTNGLMYGGAAWVSLYIRSTMIRSTTWNPQSASCFLKICIWAGLFTWGVTILSGWLQNRR